MSKALSIDLRERAIVRLAAGETVRQVAAALSVAPSSVVKWSQRLRRTGSVAPGKLGGHVPPKIAGAHEAWLRERIKTPFTLRGLAAELADRGLKVDYRTVWKFGYSFKKTALAAEQLRPDIARRRARWKRHQGRIDPARLVFIDETWAKTNMAPLRGWAPKGQRLIGRAPHGHWRTMTFIAALRHDRIDVPFVLDGPVNGEAFRAYVEHVLVPVSKVSGHGLAQFRRASDIRVSRSTVAARLEGRFGDMCRGVEIRLPLAKVDDFSPRLPQAPCRLRKTDGSGNPRFAYSVADLHRLLLAL